MQKYQAAQAAQAAGQQFPEHILEARQLGPVLNRGKEPQLPQATEGKQPRRTLSSERGVVEYDPMLKPIKMPMPNLNSNHYGLCCDLLNLEEHTKVDHNLRCDLSNFEERTMLLRKLEERIMLCPK